MNKETLQKTPDFIIEVPNDLVLDQSAVSIVGFNQGEQVVLSRNNSKIIVSLPNVTGNITLAINISGKTTDGKFSSSLHSATYDSLNNRWVINSGGVSQIIGKL